MPEMRKENVKSARNEKKKIKKNPKRTEQISI